MGEFYYQIKTRDSDGILSNWAFPPLFSGKVEADSKNCAKLKVEEMYSRKFPLRVLKKDLEKQPYLLKVDEIKPDHHHVIRLFESRECRECGASFRRIDLYNDHNETYKGTEFCGEECKNIHYEKYNVVTADNTGNGKPVIYRITNKNTLMSYIGQTTQVFTLRWYQHFYQKTGEKFGAAIRGSNLDDWVFDVVEAVETPKGRDRSDYLNERERYWINKTDSILRGYNSRL